MGEVHGHPGVVSSVKLRGAAKTRCGQWSLYGTLLPRVSKVRGRGWNSPSIPRGGQERVCEQRSEERAVGKIGETSLLNCAVVETKDKTNELFCVFVQQNILQALWINKLSSTTQPSINGSSLGKR